MAKTQRLTDYTKKYDGSSLFLGNMRLTKAPSDIFSIQSLTQLYLPDNFLVALPRAIGKLINLQQLYLDNNVIGPSLCAEIGNLRQLRVLSLSHNRLQELPPETGRLVRLENLIIDNNRLTCLPLELEKIKCSMEGLDSNRFHPENSKYKATKMIMPTLQDICIQMLAQSVVAKRKACGISSSIIELSSSKENVADKNSDESERTDSSSSSSSSPPTSTNSASTYSSSVASASAAAPAASSASASAPATAKLDGECEDVVEILGEAIPSQFVSLIELRVKEIESGKGSFRCLWCKNVRFANHARVEKLKWTVKSLRRSSRRTYSRRSGGSSENMSVHLPLKHRYCSVSCALWDL